MGITGVIAILQQVPAIVHLVEGLIPGHGKGSEKKGLATGLILMAVKAVEGLKHEDLVNDQDFADGLSAMIDGSVKVYNSINKHAA